MTHLPVEVANFFLAMQLGRAGGDALRAAFTEDAVYEEPFTGAMRRHQGIDAIMTAMAAGWETPLADMRLEVTRASIDGDRAEVGWTCHSPSLPGGAGRGTNRFTLRGGRIAQLITTFDAG